MNENKKFMELKIRSQQNYNLMINKDDVTLHTRLTSYIMSNDRDVVKLEEEYWEEVCDYKTTQEVIEYKLVFINTKVTK